MKLHTTLSLVVVLLPFLLLANPIAFPVSDEPVGEKLIERATELNAFLTLLLEYLPALDATLTSLVGVITLFENFLVILTGQQITYNEIGGACKPYTLLFARGTTEPGNVGILVGPPLILALNELSSTSASNLAIQGVNSYAATVTGYLAGGDAIGSAAMTKQIVGVKALCPSTKLVVSGYSQGAQLVHNALGLLDAETAGWVEKVVMFGDPYNGTAIPGISADKVLTYCHVGDDICTFGDLILIPHLTYALQAEAAAAFIVS